MTKLYDTLTWSQFINLYIQLINSSIHNSILLRFSLEMNEFGWINYIKKFAEKAIERNENPQQCLDLLFNSIYSTENEEMYFDECLFDVLIEAGAKFPVDKLFNRKYTNTKYTAKIYEYNIPNNEYIIIERNYTLYDEVDMYPFRGLLIDYLIKRNLINPKKYAKWENIVAKKMDCEERYDNITEDRRLSILKYHSKYLKLINRIYIRI